MIPPWPRLALALGVSALLHLAVLLLMRPPAPPSTGDFSISVLIVPLREAAPPVAPPAAAPKERPSQQAEPGRQLASAVPARPAPEESAQRRQSASVTVGPISAPDEPPPSRLRDAATYIEVQRLRASPALVGRLTARYPRLAYQQRRSAVVVLQLMIDENGTVAEALPLPGASEDFVEAALEALRGTRFRPAEGPDGRPARARAYFEVSFVLE